MVSVEHLAFAYGAREILKDVSFSVPKGSFTAILGSNGAGKSTLLSCIAQIHKPKQGKILLNNIPITSLSRKARAQHIAYVAQKPVANPTTVFDSVLLGRMPYRRLNMTADDIQECEKVLVQLNLTHLRMRLLTELSGGELQKVMLARALVQKPEVLLLDEPTSHLDLYGQYAMLAQIQHYALHHSLTVMMVIHDINLALRYCNHFLFLKDGKIHTHGCIDMVTPEVLHEIYGVHAHVETHHGVRVAIIDEGLEHV